MDTNESASVPPIRQPGKKHEIVYKWRSASLGEAVSALRVAVESDKEKLGHRSVTILWQNDETSRFENLDQISAIVDLEHVEAIIALRQFDDRSQVTCFAARHSFRAFEPASSDGPSGSIAATRLGELKIYIEDDSPGAPPYKFFSDPALYWNLAVTGVSLCVLLLLLRAPVLESNETFLWPVGIGLAASIPGGIVNWRISKSRERRGWLTRKPIEKEPFRTSLKEVGVPLAVIIGSVVTLLGFVTELFSFQ